MRDMALISLKIGSISSLISDQYFPLYVCSGLGSFHKAGNIETTRENVEGNGNESDGNCATFGRKDL